MLAQCVVRRELHTFVSVNVASMVNLLKEGQMKLPMHFCGMMERLFSSNQVIPGEPASTTKAPSKETILRSATTEETANVLWDLVEKERRQRIAFNIARKQ